ncbi:MAG: shikimate kinase [Anaerovoracaceae bacterium]
MMIYGLVGEKLSHSYSKLIHEKLGYNYNLFSLSESKFDNFIANRQYDGLNITIPYKQRVMPLCDELSPLAKEIGAVNTLYFHHGKLCGTNTDYPGFLYAAARAGINFKNQVILILGNGGTSLMAEKAVSNSGAMKIYIASRHKNPRYVSYNDLDLCKDATIIVNTTPVGTYPNNWGQLISLDDFPNCKGVIDVVYNPFTTNLLLQAKDANIPYTNGLPMLVAQATAAGEYFLGNTDFQGKNQKIIQELSAAMENIVLIGMPGCGKTTLGKLLSEAMDRPFVDMDQEIEKIAGETIPQIFKNHGQAHFRNLEENIAKAVGKEQNQIISTGGGAVLRKSTIDALRQNGRVVFITRALDELSLSGRPLSKDRESIKSIYETRLPLYNKYMDLTFDNANDKDSIVKKLLSILEK